MNYIISIAYSISFCNTFRFRKPFCYVTTVCTVDLLVPKRSAQARTVQPVFTICSPHAITRFSIFSHTKNPPFFDKRYYISMSKKEELWKTTHLYSL